LERHRGAPRPGWEKIVEGQGMVYGIPGRGQGGAPRPYWDESVHYTFSMDEVLSLEADVEVVHSMCLEAVEHVVTAERFRDFAIPEYAWEAVAASWRRSDPHVYGRFDLRYDGGGPAKLLEYNADTPTTLLEASILQWHWLQDVFPDDDQWNSLHEKLVERWGEIRGGLPGDDVYFTWSRGDPTGEDHVTVGYLQETAAEAGMDTVGLAIEDIGWDPDMSGTHYMGKHAYYYTELVGPDSSDQYTIRQSHNDCTPSCANGNTTSKDLHWNGSDYVA
jgi:glutathionylspermidine synthase